MTGAHELLHLIDVLLKFPTTVTAGHNIPELQALRQPGH
jgi:hypothetical protein